MTKLGVNIDHSATVRQARYRDADFSSLVVEPCPLEIALEAELGGADSITAHLREDRRHIIDSDIAALRKGIKTKLNLEMACTDGITEVALATLPDYVCLVPENRREVTTEGGINLMGGAKKTERTLKRLAEKNIICSVFIDPESEQIRVAADIGAPVIELHTGSYANAWKDSRKRLEELKRIERAAAFAKSLGLTVNSGHGINYLNVSELLKVADFNELNIGHTIISRALTVGVRRATREMKELILNHGG